MALLKPRDGDPEEVAINTTTGTDEVNEREEFWIELLEGRGDISKTLMLTQEEAADLRDALDEFVTSYITGSFSGRKHRP